MVSIRILQRTNSTTNSAKVIYKNCICIAKATATLSEARSFILRDIYPLSVTSDNFYNLKLQFKICKNQKSSSVRFINILYANSGRFLNSQKLCIAERSDCAMCMMVASDGKVGKRNWRDLSQSWRESNKECNQEWNVFASVPSFSVIITRARQLFLNIVSVELTVFCSRERSRHTKATFLQNPVLQYRMYWVHCKFKLLYVPTVIC